MTSIYLCPSLQGSSVVRSSSLCSCAESLCPSTLCGVHLDFGLLTFRFSHVICFGQGDAEWVCVWICITISTYVTPCKFLMPHISISPFVRKIIYLFPKAYYTQYRIIYNVQNTGGHTVGAQYMGREKEFLSKQSPQYPQIMNSQLIWGKPHFNLSRHIHHAGTRLLNSRKIACTSQIVSK